MAKFRKKPVVIEATQWFKVGDHPVVRTPSGMGNRICEACGHPSNVHGWCPTLEGDHIVCVADWIITGIKGEHYPCKPDIFAATYEPVEPADMDPIYGDNS